MSKEWEDCHPLCNLRKIPRYMSDHNRLIMCTELVNKSCSKPFCFENSWLKHAEFYEKIQEIWAKKVSSKSNIESWCIKMDRVKKFLKGWGQSLKGHTRKYKNILRKELEVLEKQEEGLSTDQLDRKSFIQAELMRLLEEEESYWHKRSNVNWLLKGDNNTTFFHRVANGKKRKYHFFSDAQ